MEVSFYNKAMEEHTATKKEFSEILVQYIAQDAQIRRAQEAAGSAMARQRANNTSLASFGRNILAGHQIFKRGAETRCPDACRWMDERRGWKWCLSRA